jgi:hypothetical protein
MRERATALLSAGQDGNVLPLDAFLLHALCVGLAVLGLALDDADGGDTRKVAVINAAIEKLGRTAG